MNWTPPEKPAELTETRLIQAILDGTFPVGSNLPAERELAVQMGITRPTLREVLQRLARDGWLEIHHGKPTRVRNYWEEGSLAVLVAFGIQGGKPPIDFVTNLLDVRRLMAPEYTRLAFERNPRAIADFLTNHPTETDSTQVFAEYDWRLHRQMCILSGNPVFTLFINSVQRLYLEMGLIYFEHAETRAHSTGYYTQMLAAAQAADCPSAFQITQEVMSASRDMWVKFYQA
ncbi:MAG TPA: fatty acid metabolism transcriptional regulator FadR [Anaerolineaceae bacterium]|jgi:GntR family negative regulator for fad regulon and positive regulator of fabA|nr:fatty acid metabolism transcriptional regulator FadR [Anaerolineaceae bacterium]